jgi:hypothetical protein
MGTTLLFAMLFMIGYHLIKSPRGYRVIEVLQRKFSTKDVLLAVFLVVVVLAIYFFIGWIFLRDFKGF